MRLKKLISILLAACTISLLCFSVLTANAKDAGNQALVRAVSNGNNSQADYVLGDSDGDGFLTIKDAACIQLYLAKLYTGYINLSVCDVNGDGDFNIKDAAYIQLKLAKLIVDKDDNPATEPPTEATEPTVTQPVTVPTEPTTVPVVEDFNESYAHQVVDLINNERAAVGLAPLAEREDMDAIAQIRAKEIVINFSHTRPNGESCFSLAIEQGIAYRTLGENIAYGYASPEAVMTGWMNSSGHKANILSESYDGVGVAAYKYNGTYYWVQYFIGSR